jgi:cholesterol 7-dehydrogenase
MKDIIILLLLCVAAATCYQGANLFKFPLTWKDLLIFCSFRDVSNFLSSLSSPASTIVPALSYLLGLMVYFVPAIFLWFLVKLYRVFFQPLNLVRHLGDIGYVETREQNKRNSANIVRKTRKIGDLPPVYPNGWFHVCYSDEVPRKQVKYVQQLGEHFAVFRGEDGEVHVLEAYCLHMGANLAVGGQVIGNCLECPFHGWRYRGSDGKCVTIPYADDPSQVPEIAKLKSWPCMERNDSVLMWYHAEGSDPLWEPEEMPQITNKEWTYQGQTTHYINCHIEEIPDNGADIAHFGHLHSPIIAAGTDIRSIFQKKWNIFQHLWVAEWAQMEEPNSHIGELRVAHDLGFLSWKLPFTRTNVVVHQVGPGLVNLHFKTPFGDVAIVQSVTPVEPMVQRMLHRVYCSRFVPTFVAKIILYVEALQVDRDVMIWNNKMWRNKPLFMKEESMMVKHRRWYSQFYSKNSPKLKDIIHNSNGFDW